MNQYPRERKKGAPSKTAQQRRKNRATLDAMKPPKVAMGFVGFGTFGPAGPARSLITGEIFPVETTGTSKPVTDEDIWVVFGADCPWNPTPGERLVKHFKTRAEEQAFRRQHMKGLNT